MSVSESFASLLDRYISLHVRCHQDMEKFITMRCISKFHTVLQSLQSSRLPGGFGSMYRYRVSGALSTLEHLEPTEMAASSEYVYLTWSIRSDICSDTAQYYI